MVQGNTREVPQTDLNLVSQAVLRMVQMIAEVSMARTKAYRIVQITWELQRDSVLSISTLVKSSDVNTCGA